MCTGNLENFITIVKPTNKKQSAAILNNVSEKNTAPLKTIFFVTCPLINIVFYMEVDLKTPMNIGGPQKT